ncbi:MAG: DUF3408 domain-containing protein [Bacteroidales bacterium]
MSKVDEDYVMGLIAGDAPAKRVTPSVSEAEVHSPEMINTPKERKGKPKVSEVKAYEETFLRKVEMRDRQQICIGGRTYEKLSEKVFAMGGRKIAIGSFIECLLSDHFKQYESIMEQVESNRKKQLSDD